MAICRICGKEVSAEDVFCRNCGTSIREQVGTPSDANVAQPVGARPYIDNHLTKSILVTIFCCLPLGIAAIIQSASVNGKLQAGDYEGAKAASAKADQFANYSIIIGLVIGVLYFIGIMMSTLR